MILKYNRGLHKSKSDTTRKASLLRYEWYDHCLTDATGPSGNPISTAWVGKGPNYVCKRQADYIVLMLMPGVINRR